jgi:hypothetical protein
MDQGMSRPWHEFKKSLAMSHDAESLPLWEQLYRHCFRDFDHMVTYRDNRPKQLSGIDRGVVLKSGRKFFVDEKIRGRAPDGSIYTDIALEYISDVARAEPGWVEKPLDCDYIAYANAPAGKAWLLPVPALQRAWERNRAVWVPSYFRVNAFNRDPRTGRTWQSVCCPVPVDKLFEAIGRCLRFEFIPFEY